MRLRRVYGVPVSCLQPGGTCGVFMVAGAAEQHGASVTVDSPASRRRPAQRQRSVWRGRRSLRSKAVLVTVLPILALALLTAVILTVQRRATLDAIARNLSQSVASVLATSLDVRDLPLVNTQLRAAVTSPSVAFVDVQPAGQELRYFTSAQPDTDWLLRAQYDAFVNASPHKAQFQPSDRVSAYNDALRALQPGTPDSVRQHLKEATATLAAQPHSPPVELTRLDVYELPNGARQLRFTGDPRPRGTLLFTMGIGVALGDLHAVLNRQLQLVLLTCALVGLVAALSAYLAVRRLVQTILIITEAAEQASLGRIHDALKVDSNDELADLAGAIERLRVSMQLALSRLLPGGRAQ